MTSPPPDQNPPDLVPAVVPPMPKPPPPPPRCATCSHPEMMPHIDASTFSGPDCVYCPLCPTGARHRQRQQGARGVCSDCLHPLNPNAEHRLVTPEGAVRLCKGCAACSALAWTVAASAPPEVLEAASRAGEGRP